MRSPVVVCVVLLLSSVFLIAQEASKPSGEEAHLLALESAWNHAEQSKDAAALGQLVADNLVSWFASGRPLSPIPESRPYATSPEEKI